VVDSLKYLSNHTDTDQETGLNVNCFAPVKQVSIVQCAIIKDAMFRFIKGKKYLVLISMFNQIFETKPKSMEYRNCCILKRELFCVLDCDNLDNW